MRIILAHAHYSTEHLVEVAEQMRSLGAPTIKAVWLEGYGEWQALEGCHRIRAAKALGLVPVIEPVEYSDASMFELLGPEGWEDSGDVETVAGFCDKCIGRPVIEFEG